MSLPISWDSSELSDVLDAVATVNAADAATVAAKEMDRATVHAVMSSIARRSKLTAPDFERLAHTLWPEASLASSGARAFSSDLAARSARPAGRKFISRKRRGYPHKRWNHSRMEHPP
jgi:hypothetical protein